MGGAQVVLELHLTPPAEDITILVEAVDFAKELEQRLN
jgi:hypothetical protein